MDKKITFQGNALTLSGDNVEVGQKAPVFQATSQSLEAVTLDNFKGKVKVINTFPSLDTPVCDLQVKEFNQRASELSDDIAIIGISKDLPFAQKRFCDANKIEKSVVVSDYKDSSFGLGYGALIKELNLLARGVFIIDQNNVIKYKQLAGEITNALNYDEAFEKLNEITRS